MGMKTRCRKVDSLYQQYLAGKYELKRRRGTNWP